MQWISLIGTLLVLWTVQMVVQCKVNENHTQSRLVQNNSVNLQRFCRNSFNHRIVDLFQVSKRPVSNLQKIEEDIKLNKTWMWLILVELNFGPDKVRKQRRSTIFTERQCLIQIEDRKNRTTPQIVCNSDSMVSMIIEFLGDQQGTTIKQTPWSIHNNRTIQLIQQLTTNDDPDNHVRTFKFINNNNNNDHGYILKELVGCPLHKASTPIINNIENVSYRPWQYGSTLLNNNHFEYNLVELDKTDDEELTTIDYETKNITQSFVGNQTTTTTSSVDNIKQIIRVQLRKKGKKKGPKKKGHKKKGHKKKPLKDDDDDDAEGPKLGVIIGMCAIVSAFLIIACIIFCCLCKPAKKKKDKSPTKHLLYATPTNYYYTSDSRLTHSTKRHSATKKPSATKHQTASAKRTTPHNTDSKNNVNK